MITAEDIRKSNAVHFYIGFRIILLALAGLGNYFSDFIGTLT